MNVTVAKGSIDFLHTDAGAITLRVYSSQSFADSLGVTVPKGRVGSPFFYKEIPCSIDAGVVTYPQFSISSTEDALSDPEGAGYTFALYDELGNPLGVVYKDLRVPAISPTTLGLVAVFNDAQPADVPLTYLTAAQTLSAIQAATAGYGLGDMTKNVFDPTSIAADAFDRINHHGHQTADTISDLDSHTRGLLLTGLPIGDNTALAETDTLLQALAKAKFQLASVTSEYLSVTAFQSTPSADLTDALSAALLRVNESNAKGGKILIPSGKGTPWVAYGGFDIPDSTTIEGVGKNLNGGHATHLQLIAGSPNNYMFAIGNGNARRDCGIKDIFIDLSLKVDTVTGAPLATGLLITNPTGHLAYRTRLKNVSFSGGLFGINVLATGAGDPFECILNHYVDVDFLGCRTAFHCNTNNSGFRFDVPYFALPTADSNFTKGGLALDIFLVGNLSVHDHLCVGSQATQPTGSNDGSIFLLTTGAYNNISICDGQDEKLHFIYQNSTNPYAQKAIAWRNNLIQSSMQFNAQASVISDNNTFINFVGRPTLYDSGSTVNQGWCRFQQISKNYVDMRNTSQLSQPNPVLSGFTNPYSRIIDEMGRINGKIIQPTGTTTTFVANSSQGAVNIPASASSVTVFNNLVDPTTIINAYFRGGVETARIACVIANAEFFTIYLTAPVSAERSIGWEIVG